MLGAVCGGVTITGLAADTLQGDAVILDILRRAGARFTADADGLHFEKAPLHGVDIDLADCPDLGPVLMVLGLLCSGTTCIRNAQRLRLKESDRIAAMEAELQACGGRIQSDGGQVVDPGLCRGAARPRRPAAGPQRPPCGDEPYRTGAGRRAAGDHRRSGGRGQKLAGFL